MHTDLRVALHPEGVDRNFHGIQCFLIELWSPSTRRAWIEIGFSDPFSDAVPVALHPEGVDRNKTTWCLTLWKHVALHPEGVDRNGGYENENENVNYVALHPEGVDRNIILLERHDLPHTVALHPEGVDRNLKPCIVLFGVAVALHPEGVDRNSCPPLLQGGSQGRPPPGGRG